MACKVNASSSIAEVFQIRAEISHMFRGDSVSTAISSHIQAISTATAKTISVFREPIRVLSVRDNLFF